MRRHVFACLMGIGILALRLPSFGAELLVPSQYPSIQAAIDAAVDDDTVIVSPGTYTGYGNRDIDFKGKAIIVRSIDTNDPNVVAATIIDCQQQGRGFYLNGCVDATISGLTITNGLADSGGGIYIQDSNVTLSNCRIAHNATKAGVIHLDPNGGYGGGLYCARSTVEISQCSLSNNRTGHGGDGEYIGGKGGCGGAVGCVGSSVIIRTSEIRENLTGAGGLNDFAYGGVRASAGNGAGICCDETSCLEISDCNILGNSVNIDYEDSSGRGGGIYCASVLPLKVINCKVSDNKAGTSGGGGIFCRSAEIYNSTISNNSTSDGSDDSGMVSAGDGGSGGGIYCAESLELLDCTISYNYTGSGGGSGYLATWGGHGGDGGGVWAESIITRECIFSGNTTGYGGCGGGNGSGGCGSDGRGGGVFCDFGKFTDCIITNNQGGSGGGVFCSIKGELIHCDVKSNSTWYKLNHGGGIYCTEGTIIDCTLMENRTGKGGHGGGLYSTSCILTDSVILSNRTGDGWFDGFYGGPSGSGGGIYSESCVITNCLITGNMTGNCLWDVREEQSNGGGLYGEALVISNSTIIGNITGEYNWYENQRYVSRKGKGGGVFCSEEIEIVDSIIWNNQPDGLYSINSNSVSYCDIQDVNYLGGVGNISFDPQFIRPGYWADVNDVNIVVEPNDPNAIWVMGDYHLSQIAAGQASDSPCVDTGSDLAVNLGMDRFTTRTDKVSDTGIVDMGFHYIEHIADLNDDKIVDIYDLSILAYQWQQSPSTPPADIAPWPGDGIIDFRDLVLLAENWLWPE